MFRFTRTTIILATYTLAIIFSTPLRARELVVPYLTETDSLNRDSSLIQKMLNLDEIVITGTRTPKLYSKSPILTKIISSKSLEQAGTTSLQDALLDNVPGLITDNNAMGSNLKLRGLSSRYMLFLLDGQPLMKEGANGNVDLNQINIEDIDHIEYLGGAASALYGSNAVGAVINFISKKNTSRWSAGLNKTNGSNDTKHLSIHVNNNNRILSTKWSGFRNSSDGFKGTTSTNTQYAYLSYGSNLSLTFHPSDYWDTKTTTSFFQHKTYQVIDEQGLITDNLKRKLNTSLVTNIYNLNKSNILSLSGNYQLYDTYNTYLENKGDQQKSLESTLYKVELLDTWTPSEFLQIVSGIGYDYKDIWSESFLGINPTRQSIEESHALAQADWNIIDNLTLVSGLRLTHNQSFGSSVDPKISLMYTFNSWKFRTGFSTAFRSPSVRELYYDFHHGPTFQIVGNPDLDAEKGKYYSASIEYTLGNFNTSISGFYNKINDKIDGVYSMNQERMVYSYININKATLKGFDINTAWAINTEWLLKGAYSYCDAKDNNTGLQLQSNMRHTGNASLTWSPSLLGQPMSLLLSGRFSSPQQYENLEIDKETGKQRINNTNSKPYKIVKFTYTKPFKIGRQTIKLSFKIDNIFNFEDSTYHFPGRTYTFGFSYHIN